MDSHLRLRYASLTALFGWDDPHVAGIKTLILERGREYSVRLREDARLFLVVNLSEMILRGYALPIPGPSAATLGTSPDPSAAVTLSNFRDFTLDTVMRRIDETLEIIMRDLAERRSEEEASAHQVMRAIDRNWEQLALRYGWG